MIIPIQIRSLRRVRQTTGPADGVVVQQRSKKGAAGSARTVVNA